MSCNHNNITDLDLPDNKHYLVYCGSDLIDSGHVKNKITSAHTVETFTAPQAHINKGLALGLPMKVDHLIKAMENGATLPANVIDGLHDVVWDMDMDYGNRMKALGHGKPE